MRTFTIDSENNVTAFNSENQPEANETNRTEVFTTREELAKLAGGWPAVRLIGIWNSLPGLPPLKKFTDRKKAIARIWKAILQGAGEECPQNAAPARGVRPRSTKPAKATKKAGKLKKGAQEAKGLREGSKTAAILELLRRPKGATLQGLMEGVGWQAHSLRGFLSAVVAKKMGLKVESSKEKGGQRTYRIAAS